ncbi:Aste57867_13547 [Aphanomyces stellatus]|uniref:Aste57867_13547 protein n=1 Tax=Aphanomyces stellatus TaxID=120398 RepID=A0A485KYE7_9STRA|nr:hypothetical protein As57867_013497 [Aphanomyces stellatus]VFT90385.1 Aste57867_13547 [Aphanomyces stellatus]
MKLTLKAKHTGKPQQVELPKKEVVEEPVEESNDDGDDDEDDADGDDEEGEVDDDDDDDDDLPADDNFDGDDVDDAGAADDENDEGEGAVGFADAMSKVLNQTVEEEKAPILAKRVTSQMREISKDKKESSATKLSAKEKRAREEKDMVIPGPATMASDKALRAIATKGVVALFNAIAKHQHGQQQQDGAKQIKSLSKDSFLGLLKQQGKKSATPAQEAAADSDDDDDKPNWSVVQDDFMMGAKLKDWDKDDGEGAAEEDAWNVEEHIDSDNEGKPAKKKAAQKKPVHKGKKQRTK